MSSVAWCKWQDIFLSTEFLLQIYLGEPLNKQVPWKLIQLEIIEKSYLDITNGY